MEDLKQVGVKFDKGKMPWHLLPFDAVAGIVQILDFGANKYTTNYETEWDRLLNVPSVTNIKITTPTENVALVTKKTSEELILNLPKDKDKTVGIGKNEIQTKLRGTPNVGSLIQNLVNETLLLGGELGSKNLDWTKNSTSLWSQTVVKSADQENSLTLTIVTKQGNLEVFFAPSATTDLDFWETIWKDLKEQLDISKPLNQTGNRNWEKGMDWSRPFSALHRHLEAWWNGENHDPETGYSHLWHAGCCILFLIAYERRGIGKDDRPEIN